jgi:D-sedoheptulose 7-phosphate isomerase
MDVIQAARAALDEIDPDQIERTLQILSDHPVIFCIGNGGGYAHATHMASDLRKIAHKRAFAFDNGAELTARINDDRYANAWYDWIKQHNYDRSECVVFVFTVGGGDTMTSQNLVRAYDRGTLTGICGAAGGDLAREGWPIIIPSFSTPVIEGVQSVIAHHLVEQLAR